MKTIPEQNLLEFTRCPLRLSETVLYARSGVELGIRPILAEALLAAFEKKPKPLKWIRDQMELQFRKHPEEERPEASRIAAWAGRVYQLVRDYDVLQPFVAYRQNVRHTCVIGDYAVLRRAGKSASKQLLILKPCFGKEPWPDVADYVRWLHLTEQDPEADLPAVLHYSFTTGFHCLSNFVYKTATAAVEHAVQSYLAGFFYPAPGRHCESCQTHHCVTKRGSAWTA
jgi:hypothetical protein